MILSPHKKILFYYPFGFEVDILPLLKEFRKKRYKIYIPHIESVSFKMLPFEMPFYKNKFGIFERSKSKININKVDIVIVPTLGIDKNLGRVGFGAGMYDRFIERFYKRYSTMPKIVFVSRMANYAIERITERYDILGDIFITPKLVCERRKYGISKHRNRNMVICDRPYNLRRYRGDSRISNI